MNSTPCLNWLEGGGPSGKTHYLQKRRATPAVNAAPRGWRKLPRWHAVIQYMTWIRRSSTYEERERGSQTGRWTCRCALLLPGSRPAHGKHTLGLRPVSRGAYCRSTLAVLLATSSKVLLLLGCLVPFRLLFFLISSPPTPASFIMVFFFLRRLTSRRADSHTCWWCSCSGPALSSCRPPPGVGRRSPAPGRRRAPRSGSPSAAGRRASAWPPRCSWPAGSSTSHPVVGRVCWGCVGRKAGVGGRNKERRVEWERSVMWWERRERQK